MKALATFLIFATTTVIWYFSALPRNYRKARQTGLPVHISPVDPSNPLWLVFVSIVHLNGVSRLFPAFMFDRVKLTVPGWEFHYKYEMHARFGKAFVLVGPANNTVYVADPEMAHTVLARRKDFGRVKLAAEMMAKFGTNVISSDGDEWQRHRRITAPVFNERIMDAVWTESAAQARDMLREFTHDSSLAEDGKQASSTTGTFEGMKRLTINVITSIIFGARSPWSSSKSSDVPSGFKTTFLSCVLTIVNNFFMALLMPASVLRLPFMPKLAQEVGIAVAEFSSHCRTKIAEERRAPAAHNTLVSQLVKIADQGSAHAGNGSVSKAVPSLNEDEITGNLFIFAIAGFDTSANTLVYSVMALAIHPELQDWVAAQIDEVAKLHPHGEYATCFPLLSRVLALVFEALRLYTPVSAIGRITNGEQDMGDVHFPSDTIVQVCAGAIHAAPQVWSPGPLAFRPQRWLSGTSNSSSTLDEKLVEPARGSFMPWSGGPRYCPGMKMAQVELVRVVSEIFREYRVDVVQKEGETVEEARARLQRLVDDSSPRLTNQMNQPEVLLKYVKR